MIIFKPLLKNKTCQNYTFFTDFNSLRSMNIPFVTNHVGDSGENIPMTKDKMGNTAEIQASVRQ